jgi:hypothetical protein
MNEVLQADDYFRQTFELVRADYEAGKTVVLATSDHGEEIRDHGVFGHASATFWNEKIVVPFMLGLPHATLSPDTRRPALTSHVDVWPTLFDYMSVAPRRNPATYSDGHSLLDTTAHTFPYVAGRFFPYADRPSALIDSHRKYWFRVSEVTSDDVLCIEVSRVTDLQDRGLGDASALRTTDLPAFAEFQSTFWRFIRPVSTPGRAKRCPESVRERPAIGP